MAGIGCTPCRAMIAEDIYRLFGQALSIRISVKKQVSLSGWSERAAVLVAVKDMPSAALKKRRP
jgi:hypothetical protein